MSEKLVFAELKASGHLPSPKGIALTVMQLCQEEDISLHNLAHVIQGDPALAGRIIKMANYVNPNKSRPIASVTTDTLILIGIHAVREAVLCMSLIHDYRDGQCKLFDYESFWSFAVAMGSAAQAIGAAIRIAPPAEMFNCGLMNGIGQLALVTARPQAYCEILHDTPDALEQAELDRSGIDQHEMMVLMLQDWGMPRLFIDALFHHRNPIHSGLPENSRPLRITYTLQLASLMAEACLLESVDETLSARIVEVAQMLELDQSQIDSLQQQTVQAWTDWGGLLKVRTRQIQPHPHVPQPAPTPAAAETISPAAIPLRILVASADANEREALNSLLSGAGHTVQPCENGMEASQLIARHQPQVVIASWLLPGQDGVSLCRQLRGDPAGEQVFFILLSPFEDERRKVEAYEAGADEFMRSPLNPRLLSACMLAAQRSVKRRQDG